MPTLIQKLLKKEYLFYRVLSFKITEWQILAEKLEPEWKIREQQRLQKKPRKNCIGQGRPYSLGEFSNLLFAVLLYLRTNIGYELIGLLLDVDKNVIKRLTQRIMPLLTDRFIPRSQLNRKQRTNNLDEFLTQYPELKEVLFDGSELPIERPKKRQKRDYSGKKKRHTRKIQVALDGTTKLLLAVSKTAHGKLHDKKQLERIGWDHRLPQKITRRGDIGYQGMSHWQIPKKKPRGGTLTRSEKIQNKKLARQRIFVEHGIRGLKIFRRIGEVVKIKSVEKLDAVILATANLYNFKRLIRQGV